MEPNDALQVYYQLINNPQILKNGKEFLEDYLTNFEGFAVASCKVLATNEVDEQIRIYVGVLLKNLIMDNWDINKTLQNQKKEIRELLLHGILMNVGCRKIIEIITLIIAEIIRRDGFDMWAHPLRELIMWSQTENISIMDTGLEFFCIIFSKTDNRVNIIVPQLMPALFQMFTYGEMNEKIREKLLVLLYLAVQSFAYADGTDNKLVSQCFDETFETWMALFISALQTSPKSCINIKRYILKILTVIFRDFTFYSRQSISSCLSPIWTFFNQILPLYILNTVYDIPLDCLDDNLKIIESKLQQFEQAKKNPNQQQFQQSNLCSLDLQFLPSEEEYDNDIQGLTVQAIELVGTLITKESLYMLVKFAVFPIINALAHFMLFTRNQEKAWISDPNQFVIEEEDEDNLRSLRFITIKIISDLIEKFGDQAIQAVLIISEKFLMNYDQSHTTDMIQELFNKLNLNQLKGSYMLDFNKDKLMQFVKTSSYDCNHPDHSWKKREVGLQILGSFSNDIIFFQTKHNSSFNFTSLIQNLVLEIENQNCIPILIAKSLWTISRFSEVIASKHVDLFLPLFKVAANCLAKNFVFPIKLTACKALGMFTHKIVSFSKQIDKQQIEQSEIINENILIYIFDIIQYTSEETLHIVLDTLIQLNKLSLKFAPFVAELGGQHLLNLFTIFHGEQLIGKLLIELITQLTKNQESFLKIYQVFQPFLLECFNLFQTHVQTCKDLSTLKPQDLTLMSSLFDITSTFLINCTDYKQSEALINLFESLVKVMQINEDMQLQINASICLKNYIKVAYPHIQKNNYVGEIVKVINKLLEVPTNSTLEGRSIYVGNLIMFTFHQLMNGSADLEILKLVCNKIMKSRLASVIQGHPMVKASIMNKKPHDTVNFLTTFSVDNRMGLKVLIDKWLLLQPVFRGKSTKNALYLALMKLFLLKDKRLENLLVIAYNPSHTNVNNDVYTPFKIFSTLIRALNNEMAPSRKDKEQIPNKKQVNGQADNDDDYMKENGDYDERLEVDDCESDEDTKDQNKIQDDDNLIEVDLDVIHDEDGEQDIQKRFATGEKQGGGLGDLEVGSINYITDGLGFIIEEEGECDETTEEDLQYLKDPCAEMNTVDLLKDFFNNLAKTDPDYFQLCLKNLLKEDVTLLQKYIKIKNL